MKNIHLISPDKSKIFYNFYNTEGALISTNYNGVNIYITSDEEIKEGDWYLVELFQITGEYDGFHIEKCTKLDDVWCNDFNMFSARHKNNCKKIILTDNKDLIADGVQAIDDEFLEWFVKNSSCEWVEVTNEKIMIGWEPDYSYEHIGIDGSKEVYQDFYKISIPKEEPKQTIEEVANRYFPLAEKTGGENYTAYRGFIEGAKRQAKRMYSEEEVLDLLLSCPYEFEDNIKSWFEQSKKK